MNTQTCQAEGCEREAAFRTRTRPTWCEPHIAETFAERRLELLEKFTGPKDHLLTRCRDCACETHVRFEYVLGLGDRHGCGACRWREWAEDARRMSAGQFELPDLAPVDLALVRSGADANGYDYLGPLTDPSLSGDPHHVRCKTCRRLSAERFGDIAWGCSCRVNAKRAQPVKKRERTLLRESDDPAKRWWAHDLNADTDWDEVTPKDKRPVWWRYPDRGHEFQREVYRITGGRPSCDRCTELHRKHSKTRREKFSGLMVADVPELLAAWDDTGDPSSAPVLAGWQDRTYVFPCEQGHRRPRKTLQVLDGYCPSCSASESRQRAATERAAGVPGQQFNPEIRAQWHPDNTIAINRVGANSQRMIRWLCQTCGHDWIQPPCEREKRYRLLCPACDSKLGSLAAFYPELAQQWAESNPTTPWHIVPNESLAFTPIWVCPQDPEHVWQATNVSRVAGSQCPQCRVHGKSRIELELFEAVRERFPTAASGTPVSSPAFGRRRSWRPDIVIERDADTSIVLEYDGAYWHAGKVDLDREKTLDLLAAGYAVCRVREGTLVSLGVDDERYMELKSQPTTPDVRRLAKRFAAWVQRDIDQLELERPSTDESR